MTENIVLDFQSADKELDNTIAKLEKIGKVDKVNADQFRASNNEYLAAAQKRKAALEVEQRALEATREKLKKAFSVEDINAFNASIKNTEANIRALKGETEKVDGGMGNLTSTLKGVAAAMGIAFGIQQIVSFGKEAILLAAKGEGIRIAFKRIGDDNALEKLRAATRGATSDIDLMAAALRARNFGISTNLLAKGLELAGKVARQTGQDVTYLTDSFVDGLGRKSIRILDNLQISQVQLQQEIKKTGDFNTAVGNIVEAKLKDIGEVTDTTADKIGRLSAGWDNFKEQAGIALVDAADKMGDLSVQVAELGGEIADFMSKDYIKGFADYITSLFDDESPKSRVQATKEEIEGINKAFAKIQEDQLSRGENFAKVDEETKKKILKNTVASHNKDVEIAKEKRELTDEEKKAIEEAAKHKEAILRKEIEDNAKTFDTLNKLRLEALKIANERELLEAESGSEEELAIKIANVEKIRDFRIATEVEFQQDEINIREKAENDILELKRKFDEQWYKEKADNDKEEYKRQQKDKKENEDLLLAQTKARVNAEFDLAFTALGAIEELANQETDIKIRSLEKQLEAGQLTQEEFAIREKNIKRAAANRDKIGTLFNIGIKTAEGVINYLSNPVTAPLVPFVIASGAIQAGIVAARPVPFAKGTKSVKGGTPGIDSVHALVMPEEMIIPVDKKKRYEPILNAIFDEKISPEILNNLALGQAMRNNNQRGIDEYDLSNGMKRALRDGVYIKNMPKPQGISLQELEYLKRRGGI